MKLQDVCVVAALLILLIVGCSTGYRGTTKSIPDFHIGFNGLTIEFLKNTPPIRVFEGDRFPVMINVRNNGAYGIKGNNPAVLSIGLEKDYIKELKLQSLDEGNIDIATSDESAAVFSLEGKNPVNPLGQEQIISYAVTSGKVDPQSERHTSTIIATICYPYETIMGSTVCIDTDISNTRPVKKVCNMQDLILNNGQGAPVAVTKVEMQMLPTETDGIKPQFLIYVENKGNGIVMDANPSTILDFCTGSISYQDLNIVYLDAWLSDKKMECQLQKKTPSDELGHIKLKDKKDIIRCALKDGIDKNLDTYLSPLKIILRYGYSYSISANYVIEKIYR